MSYAHGIDTSVRVYDVAGNLHPATIVDRRITEDGERRYLLHIPTNPLGVVFVLWVPESDLANH